MHVCVRYGSMRLAMSQVCMCQMSVFVYMSVYECVYVCMSVCM